MKKLILVALIAVSPMSMAEPAEPYVESAWMASSRCKSGVAFNMIDAKERCQRMIDSINVYTGGRKSGEIDPPTDNDIRRLKMIKGNITFVQLQFSGQ